jgi:hypothetical protein
MNYRTLLTILSLLVSVAVPAFAGENRVLTAGPSSGPHLVITTPEESGKELIGRLERLADSFRADPPPITISVIITSGDYSALPPDIASGPPEGTSKVISLISEEESPVVLLLLPGNGLETRIVPGARGTTAPRWYLEAVTESLSKKEIPWALAENRMAVYRIGWITENPLLAQYLRARIPAVALESNADLSGAVKALAESLSSGLPVNQDRHYLVFPAEKRLSFVSERALVAIVMAASAGILMFLFIFSFLFGQKSEQHLRDLVRVWWLPFIYLLVTTASLYAGSALVSFFFKFRFGDGESWTLLPHLALVGKFLLSWFIIALVMSLNQLVRFPESGFIYGYIASVACIVNLFAFSSLDFSLTLLFLTVYCVSFAVYHLDHPLFQVLGILCMIAPFSPYIVLLVNGDSSILAPLFANGGFWNLRMALFVMPLQLMFSRLYHSLGAFGRRREFYLPFSPVVAFFFALVVTGFILFLPAWSKEKPLRVELRQTLDARGFTERILSKARLGNLTVIEEPRLAEFPDLGSTPESFVTVSSSSRKFIERRISELTVTPAIPAQKIEVTVSDPDNVAVYDSSTSFEPLDAGRSCRFTSGENPAVPFVIRFSSARDASLTARVRVWTRANPRGLTVLNPDIRASYLLEIDTDYAFPEGEGK